jgi:hypothetical protein
MTDDETNPGQGLVVGGGLGYRFHRRWGVSFDVSRNAHHRDFGTSLITDGHAVLIGGSAQFFFRPDTNAQPYLRFGVNYARYKAASRISPSLRPSARPCRIIETGSQNFFGPDVGLACASLRRKRFRFARKCALPRIAVSQLRFCARHFGAGLWVGSFTVGVGYHW